MLKKTFMEINWFTIAIVIALGVFLIGYLISQNLKDKRKADKDYKSIRKKTREGYETNDEEI